MKDFCISLFKKEQEEKTFKIYVAECLRISAENTARAVNGAYLTAKYEDIINRKPRDERTADEIISDIKEKVNKIR